jgi:alkanesulfonate monooxygenase SsuD/methylene tetrahydromethanopterin reductase-like flavin-dependent oxidoreductase (luciferase family)
VVIESPEFAFQLAPVSDIETSDADLYAAALEDARLGYELGYSTAWMIEHHFTDYYPTPNPLIMLAQVAARCPGLGLGTCVMVLPWYNPLRFAEDIAMLQMLSGAPLHIGIGRGTAKLEYDAFGVDMTEARDRFREAWEIVETALKGAPFTYKGKHYSVDSPLRLRPELNGRKPNFYGAIGSPQSAEIMADLSLPPLGLAQFPDHLLRSILENWDRRSREHGRSTNVTKPILVQCYVADTDEEARAEAKRYLPAYFQRQVEHYEVLKNPWKDIAGYEQFSRFFANLLELSDPAKIDKFLNMNAIGSADTVARRLQQLQDIGFNHFIMTTATPGVPAEVRRRNMRRFASEVMPRFKLNAAAA